MEVSAQFFWEWAVELEGKDPYGKGQEYPVWASPSLFCAMRYIYDWRYTGEDRDGE